MTNYANFDRSKFPLIIVTFTGVRETDENFTAYLDGLYANYDARKPFSLVFDATNAASPNMKYLQKQAEWMKKHENLIKTYCLGVGYVVPSALFRLALKMVFSIQKNPVPFKVFGGLEAGAAWAVELNAEE